MTKIVQHSFLGGQLDWEMMGRQDVEKYRSGATLLKNVVLHKRGAAFKRPGTNCLWSVTGNIANDHYRLVPFASTTSQGWALLFTDNAIYAVSNIGVTQVATPFGFTSYSGDELKELDYCQCGDVIYIAHQNHPPCMIAHSVSGSTHSFALTVIDLNQQANGIPSITGATVSKTGITSKGPSYTETYKVTAVYDGIETYPSDAYSNSNCADYDSSYATAQEKNAIWAAVGYPGYVAYVAKTKTYAGTAYTLPWTESQKITLNIGVPSRGAARPEQIRIYRKTGSFFGLVGIVSTAGEWTAGNTGSSVSGSVSRINYSTTEAKGNAINATNLICDDFGLDVDGFTVTGALGVTLTAAAKKATVDMKLGHVAYAETSNSDTFPEYDSSAEFSTASTYAVGDRCRHNNRYWKCRVAVETPGAWTGTTNWKQDDGYATNVFMEGDRCRHSTTSGTTYYYICKADETSGEWNSTRWTRTTATSYLTRTYTYRPCGVSSFRVQLGSGETKTAYVNSGTAATLTVTQESGETLKKFKSRADNEANIWLNTLTGDKTMSVEVRSNTASTSVSITPLAEGTATPQFVMYNLTVTGSTTANIPSSVTWEDKYYTPDVSVTPPSETEVMSGANDYPGCVCLSQQRLIWASTKNDPSRVFMSEIGAFYTYSPHDVQVADDAIDFQVSATQFPRVYHMAELKKIILFNGASEWIVDSASANSGITYETIRATQHSCIGSSTSLKPIVCNNVLLFAERTGQAVRQYGYELEDDGFGGNDISIFAQSIFNEKKIVAWAYQQHPHSTCWCVLSDGTLASLTFNREQQCIAWATHELGGSGTTKAVDIACTNAVIGNDADLKDTSEILLLVKRGNDYFIEQMRPESKDERDTTANLVCMDSVKTIYPGTTRRTGTTLVNLSTMQVVDAMSANDPHAEGFVFDTRITTAYPVVADAVGMAQMDVKCVQYANIRLMRSVGGFVKNVDTLDAVATPLVKTAAAVDASRNATIPPVDERVLLPASENRDGRITIFQNSPFPFGVTMIETDLDTEETR